MSHNMKCLKCSSENVNPLKETVEYFSDVKIWYISLQCEDCNAEMMGYFESKKIVENKYSA